VTNRVFFIQVKTNSEKLKKILELCQTHFENRQKLLIKTDTIEAARFLDDFLWKNPTDGFLPHGIEETDSFISITKSDTNPNQAYCCLNLTSSPLLNTNFSKIYEFDDKSSLEKQRISEFRFQTYKKSLIPIASY